MDAALRDRFVLLSHLIPQKGEAAEESSLRSSLVHPRTVSEHTQQAAMDVNNLLGKAAKDQLQQKAVNVAGEKRSDTLCVRTTERHIFKAQSQSLVSPGFR